MSHPDPDPDPYLLKWLLVQQHVVVTLLLMLGAPYCDCGDWWLKTRLRMPAQVPHRLPMTLRRMPRQVHLWMLLLLPLPLQKMQRLLPRLLQLPTQWSRWVQTRDQTCLPMTLRRLPRQVPLRLPMP